MVNRMLECPACGAAVTEYKNPMPVVDIIIRMTADDGRDGIVLIRRKNTPRGWALPGGFVDYGETVEAAAAREALEETHLAVADLRQMGVFSDPSRDPRHHTIATVFTATAAGAPQGGDDAAEARVFPLEALPEGLCFDHPEIIAAYRRTLS